MRISHVSLAVSLVVLVAAGSGLANDDEVTDEMINHARQGLPTAAPRQVGLSAEGIARIGPAVQKFIDNKQLAGAVTIVARRGKVVQFEAYGMMDAGKKMRKDTIFRIASMNKAITSVAAMMLCEEGKLQIDAPVSKYIPLFKDLKVGKVKAKREITVRDLLRHTSGLPRPVPDLQNYSLEGMVDKLRNKSLEYQPGTKWRYSFAHEVLCRLIEVASGKTYDKFLAKRIFRPLGMKDTGFYVPAKKLDRLAAVYGRGLKIRDPKQGFWGRDFKQPPKVTLIGGIVSTAADYMRFCLMLSGKGESLDGKRLLKPETVAEMTRNQLPEGVTAGRGFLSPEGRGFGLGFAVRVRKVDSSPESVGEYEWYGGAGTEFWLSPRDDLAVVTLSQQMPMQPLGQVVKSIVYGAIAEEKAKRYLLLDTRIVESADNAKLALGTVKKNKNNPLFGADKPWEPRYDNMYPNVIYDDQDKIYKCWYFSFIIEKRTTSTPLEKRNPESTNYMNVRPTGRDEAILYATSTDGIHWEKPELGIVEFQGSKKNNIVCRGPSGAGVFKDLRDPDPKRRYKAFYAAQVGFMQLIRFSPDGLHWGPEIRCPEIAIQSDTHANMIWSPEIQKYIGIVRHYDNVPIVGNRKIARTESADAVKWTKSKLIVEGTPLKQLHDMVIFRDGGVYLGLLGMMHYPSMKSKDGVRQHVELAWSGDSYTWHRICPGTPLIGPTPTKETKYGKMPYDWGCIFPSAPVFRDGEIQIYYGACDWYFFDWRKSGLALATLRPDGWAGYEQIDGNKPASITTTPVVCAGDKLRLSADVSRSGSIKVTILDKDNKKLAVGEPMKQTVTDAQVKWPKGFSLEKLKGKRIKLKFELRDAKLYSFSFSD